MVVKVRNLRMGSERADNKYLYGARVLLHANSFTTIVSSGEFAPLEKIKVFIIHFSCCYIIKYVYFLLYYNMNIFYILD